MISSTAAEMDFRDWIGRSMTETDVVTAYPADCFSATLDRQDPPFDQGDPLPPAWHYFYFNEVVPLAQTGPDGHQKKGVFMPPVPLPRRMWAGSKMRFDRPVRIGEEVRKVTTIADVAAKDGRTGPLCFVTLVEEVFGSDGTLTTREERTQVYRSPPGGSVQKPMQRPAPATPQWTRRIDPTSVLLFRYSALTMNSHRIHFDHDYVREVEGHPGLLVHGPLIMTLMLDLFRREMPGAVMTSLDLRAVAPIYATGEFTVHGVLDGEDSCRLWAMTQDDSLAMTAEAVFSS